MRIFALLSMASLALGVAAQKEPKEDELSDTCCAVWSYKTHTCLEMEYGNPERRGGWCKPNQ